MNKHKSHSYTASVVFPVSNTHITLSLTDFFAHKEGVLINVRADIERVPAMQADQRLDRILGKLPTRSVMTREVRTLLAMFGMELRKHSCGKISVSDDDAVFNIADAKGAVSLDTITDALLELFKDCRNWELHRTRKERPFCWTAILDIDIPTI